jgi:hypothetical protein
MSEDGGMPAQEQFYSLGGGVLLECQEAECGSDSFRVIRARQGLALSCTKCGMTYGFSVVLPLNARRAFVDRKES